jgi:hypothetical protein
LQTQSAKLNLIQASFGDGSLSRVDIIKERLKVGLLSLFRHPECQLTGGSIYKPLWSETPLNELSKGTESFNGATSNAL